DNQPLPAGIRQWPPHWISRTSFLGLGQNHCPPEQSSSSSTRRKQPTTTARTPGTTRTSVTDAHIAGPYTNTICQHSSSPCRSNCLNRSTHSHTSATSAGH